MCFANFEMPPLTEGQFNLAAECVGKNVEKIHNTITFKLNLSYEGFFMNLGFSASPKSP